MATTSLTFDIFAKDHASKVFDSVSKSSDGLKSKLGGLTKVAGLVGGAFAAVGVAGIFKGAIDEAREAMKVQKQTNAVLKSTGGVADVSGKHVGDLATRLSNLAGVDDELVQSGENVLLTFTNIRNGAGKGNDVFDQATTAALNMSSALGTDLQGSVIQVGKALNDPIKGVTALSKVGVSFTKQQRDQIKMLVASGRTMDAQKIILKELGTEFGGAAEAAADPMKKLGVVFGNLEERLGTALLPVIEKVATFLGNNLPRAMDAAGRVLGPLAAKAGQAFNILFKGDFTGGPFSEDSGIVNTLFNIRDGITDVIAKARMFWNTLTTGFTEDEGTPIERFALVIRNDVLPVIKEVAGFVADHFKPVLVGLAIAVAALISPWLLVVGALAAVVAGVVYAYTHFQTFHDIIDQVADVARSAFTAFQAVVQRVIVIVSDLWARFGDTLLSKLRIAANAIVDIVQGLLGVLTGVFDLIKAILTGKWGEAWEAIKQILGSAWDAIGGILRLGIDAISGAFEAAKAAISAAWSAIWHGIATVVTDVVINPAKNALDGLIGFISGMPGRITTAAKGMWDGIKNAFKAAVNWIIDKWNDLEFKIGGQKVFGKTLPGITIKTPNIPKLAAGGIVTSPTIALLGEAGPEAVVPLTGRRGLGGIHIDHLEVPAQGTAYGTAREIVAELRALALALAVG